MYCVILKKKSWLFTSLYNVIVFSIPYSKLLLFFIIIVIVTVFNDDK